jgi:hypothetical protein
MAFYSTMKQSTLRLALAFGLALFFCLSAVLAQTTVGVEVLGYAADPAGLGRQTANVVVTTEPITGQAIVIGTLESTEPGQMVFEVEFTPEGAAEPAAYQFTVNQTDLTENQMPSFVGVAVAVGQGGGGELEPPDAPANLVATVTNVVDLDWDADPTADTFSVYRATSPGGVYTLIADEIATNSYTDSTAVTDTQYYYIVRGVNVAGESGDSNEVGAFPSFPLGLANLAFYLNCKAPGTFTVDGSDKISQAVPTVGGVNLTQATGANQPTLINGHAIRSGGSHWLASAFAGNIREVFLVLKPTFSGSARGIVGNFNNSGNKGLVVDATNRLNDTNITQAITYYINGGINPSTFTFSFISFNDEKIVIRFSFSSALAVTELDLFRDNTGSSTLVADLEDVLVFSDAVSTVDAENIEQYLAAKYGVDLNTPQMVEARWNSGTTGSFSSPNLRVPPIKKGIIVVAIACSLNRQPNAPTWNSQTFTQIGSAYTDSQDSNITFGAYC